jgi:hypothetical protein
MTQQVKRRKQPESREAKYNRLNKRIIRQLPVTSAETMFVWNEKSRRMREIHR